MFDPPPPLEFKEGIAKRKPPEVVGVAALLSKEEDLFEKGPPPPPEPFETPRQRHARIAAAKKEVPYAQCFRCRCWCDGGGVSTIFSLVCDFEIG